MVGSARLRTHVGACVCVYVYVCVGVCLCDFFYVHVCTHLGFGGLRSYSLLLLGSHSLVSDLRDYVYMCGWVCARLNVYMCALVCVCVSTYMYIYIYIYIYLYIHIYGDRYIDIDI
jgi:hypothetical protein